MTNEVDMSLSSGDGKNGPSTSIAHKYIADMQKSLKE